MIRESVGIKFYEKRMFKNNFKKNENVIPPKSKIILFFLSDENR